MKKNRIKILIAVMIILLIAVIASIINIVYRISNKKIEEPKYSTGIEKDKNIVEKAKGKGEYKRMQIYLGDIIKKINEKEYSKVYQKIAPRFKENYFKTLEEFEKYVKENLPGDISIIQDEFEAIGEYYILKVDLVSNNEEGKIKEKKGMYFVFQEYEFDDYLFSFSKKE